MLCSLPWGPSLCEIICILAGVSLSLKWQLECVKMC